jgi:acyl-CoA synthetase (AMP-forming)/AMP-acid ligase II
VALVVARQQGQHEALAEHCRARLPAERWPDRIFYAPLLPKTPAGKLDRERIKDMIMSELARPARVAPQS